MEIFMKVILIITKQRVLVDSQKMRKMKNMKDFESMA